MTNTEIEAFVAVCQYKSITKAAKALFIGQPSLSSRILTLERELGCALFSRQRGHREITLTEEGERMYALALEYQDLMTRMHAVGPNSAPKQLRVSTINSIGTYLFLPVYERFMQMHPEIELVIQDMETPEACRKLQEGGTDIAFTTKATNPNLILSRPAFAERMVLICAKDSDYSDPVERDTLRVSNEVLINWGGQLEKWHNELFGEHETPHVRLEIIGQLRHFVSRKNKWSFLPASVARELTKDGDLRQCRTAFSVPRRVTNCLSLIGKRENLAVSAFLSCMNEELAQNWDSGEIKLLL